MQPRGAYRFWFPPSIAERCGIEQEIYVPNLVVSEGKEEFLSAVVRNTDMGLAASTFYVGLADQVPANGDTLASITTEPTSAGGYARLGLTRNSVGWPTIDEVNGVKRAVSKILTFTASGADFSRGFSRAFLASVTGGPPGKLFSFSAALSVPVQVLNGESFSMQYELYSN